eukprot:TRINITY_DN2820_c0_g1_i1.p1 TRINITY_DN2820_c0_g1~~TRINITY_DN2820_c0_g1_i1.p1  ORF type:complete len:954 (+),score=259.19 TRINITY_DN2820_c0_g1_i1:209-3070(+)
MTSKNAVKVFVRTKPTSQLAQENITVQDDKRGITISQKRANAGFVNNHQDTWGFTFDGILDNVTQDQVYQECAVPVVQSVLDGYNGTILVYGQTGAGKTFTMTGATENYKHRGIIPRTISHVFKEVRQRPDSAIVVRISYVELYNETMYDLLAFANPDAPHFENEELKIVEDANGTTHIMGLTKMIANSEEEALNLLFEGETNRAIAEHQLNKSSTRSHCIFTLYLDIRSRVESSEKITLSKLNLVDLAGSERLKKTGSGGIVMKEAMFINKSLSFLEQVIISLSKKKKDKAHVPYRQTKLTNILKDSLGGNCKTHMIANIWMEATQLEETIATLKFASRMMRVSNEPIQNVQYDPAMLVKKYEREIKELRSELAMHDALSHKSLVVYDQYTDAQRADLNQVLRRFLSDEIEDVEVANLRQVKEMLGQFKVIFKDMEREIEIRTKAKYRPKSADVQAEPVKQTTNNEEENISGVGEVDGGGFAVGVMNSKTSPRGKIGRNKFNKKPAPKAPVNIAPQQPTNLLQQQTQVVQQMNPTNVVGQNNTPTLLNNSAPNNINLGNVPEKATSPSTSGAASPQAPLKTGKSPTVRKRGQTMHKDPLNANNTMSQMQNGSNIVFPPISSAQPLDNIIPPIIPIATFDNPTRGRVSLVSRPSTASSTNDENVSRVRENTADRELRAKEKEKEIEKEEEEKEKVTKRPAPADRNLAFEEFKGTVGRDISFKLNENKETLREKKRQAKLVGVVVNDSKRRIDSLKSLIERKKQERMVGENMQDDNEEDAEIIDEEEFDAIKQLREQKRQYREGYEQLRTVQAEIDTVTRMIDQCRQKLISDFEAWYSLTFYTEEQTNNANNTNNTNNNTNNSNNNNSNNENEWQPAPVGKNGVAEDDIMDYQEKFERMGIEKMVKAAAEPEAAAFYSAAKVQKDILSLRKKEKGNEPNRQKPLKSKSAVKWTV